MKNNSCVGDNLIAPYFQRFKTHDWREIGLHSFHTFFPGTSRFNVGSADPSLKISQSLLCVIIFEHISNRS